jgi:uncharacterized Zn finger protein
MSPFRGRRDWRDFVRGPKEPPPADGIKMKKAGTTWWGQRWIQALENVLAGDSGRLARGRTYARAGRTHDLVFRGGEVTAKVTGSRPTPYAITIRLGLLSDTAWSRAIAGMAAKAQFAAELLAGQMPKDIDEVFRADESSLFPRQRSELETKCSCPDWGDPCKHVAATHYVLGEALDRDPFLLFELRGRTKAQVLDALRAARSGVADVATGAAPSEEEVAGVILDGVRAADYDRSPSALPAFSFSFDEPVSHGALLRQLGVPAAWGGAGSPADALAPLVRAAADRARRIALAEPEADRDDDNGGDDGGKAPPPAAPPKAARAPKRRGS